MSDQGGPWSGQAPSPVRPARRRALITIVVIACLAAVVIGLSAAFPGRLSSWRDWDGLLRGGAVLAIVAPALFIRGRAPLGHMLRSALIWIAVAGALLLGFAYRDVAMDAWTRLRSAVAPGYAVAGGAHQTILNRDANGGFYAIAQVNGRPVNFLIDTGASDIVLSPADAARLGVDLKSLTFDNPYETANGVGKGAHYRVDTLTLGDIHLSDVPVSINNASMSSSLLGMAFFKRLSSFRIEGDRLILTSR